MFSNMASVRHLEFEKSYLAQIISIIVTVFPKCKAYVNIHDKT